MSDTSYTNGNYQLQHLYKRLRQYEAMLAAGIHDTHDRLEMEQTAERIRADIAKMEAWEKGREKITQTEGGDGQV